jgi:hypothetical protein
MMDNHMSVSDCVLHDLESLLIKLWKAFRKELQKVHQLTLERWRQDAVSNSIGIFFNHDEAGTALT